jgi:hypothetical protein
MSPVLSVKSIVNINKVVISIVVVSDYSQKIFENVLTKALKIV